MIEYYYQIKGKSNGEEAGLYGGVQNWSFPPIFSGKVSANNKKEAKELIEIEYNKNFPLRVLNKDLNSNEFLLNIREITDQKTKDLFEVKTCLHCAITFRIIDNYNNSNESYKGSEYCSYNCKNKHYEVEKYKSGFNEIMQGNNIPVIYKITNKATKMSYIGKTTQVFTLRWYQHFYHGTGTKFHNAIKESVLTDWEFSIVEILKIPDYVTDINNVNSIVLFRENHWIEKYDTINNGYNSVNAKSKN